MILASSLWLALAAGFAGATGGYFAKLGFDPESSTVPFLTSFVCDLTVGTALGAGEMKEPLLPCKYVANLVRAALIATSFVFSGGGVAAFVMAMEGGTSVMATVLSTGTNIVCSGLYGIVMGETISSAYCLGSSLIIAGLVVMTLSERPAALLKHKRKHEED